MIWLLPWLVWILSLMPLSTQIFVSVNTQRAEPLAYSASLSAIAQARVQDMVDNAYFGHYRPDRTLALQNYMSAEERHWNVAGENLARNNSTLPVVTAMLGFRSSPSHWANIVAPEYRQLGVGVISSGSTWYFALVFSD